MACYALAQAAGVILRATDEHLLRYGDRMDVSVLTPRCVLETPAAHGQSPQRRRDILHQ